MTCIPEGEHWCSKCWLTKRTLETKMGWICERCLSELYMRNVEDALAQLESEGIVERVEK